MISNLAKYTADLDRLVGQGEQLDLAAMKAFTHNEFREDALGALEDEKKVDDFLDSLPSFSREYQAWYSEALALVRQLLPDRVEDFVRLYQKPRSRKSITSENYVIEDALHGLNVTRGTLQIKVVAPDAAIPKFSQQLYILKSVKGRFDSSLFDIKQLVQADMFDSELDAAAELNKKGFVRAAGAVAGVVLEGHLKQVCENHKVKTRKTRPGINDFAQLLKDNDVIDTPVWRGIQQLADWRNLCDHKKKTEPKPEDIDQLIAGVSRVIKTLF